MEQRWTPYEGAPTLVQWGLRARWVLAYPLQRVMFMTFTVGEILLAVVGAGLFGFSASQWDTKTAGKIASFPLLFAFATAARNSPFTFLLGIPFERRVAYHKLIAIVSNLTVYLHGVIAFVSREATDSDHRWSMWTGLCGCGCAMMLGVTSHHAIRRKLFELFYTLHWTFFIAYMVFLALHSALIPLIGAALWGADVMLRTVYMSCFQPGAGTLCRVDGTNIVEINMKGVKYEPGQYAFLAIPEIGCFQWHPISFSSAPCEGGTAKFHVRCNGDWGARLLTLAEESGPTKEHKVLVDGSYGNTSIDIDSDRYKHFLFVMGGIGVTPMRSIATSLLDQQRRGRDVRLMEMHWSVRDSVVRAVQMADDKYGLTVYHTGGEQEMLSLGTHTAKHGRMDVREVVREFKAKIMQESSKAKVAVLFCGPGAMFTPLRQACKEYSGGLVSFDLHTETFEF